MSLTCSSCRFFRLFYGERQGQCFGTPPPHWANGAHAQNVSPPPLVKSTRVQCSLYLPLEAGESNLKEKVTPETPADARPEHIAHIEALTARRADSKEYVGPGPYGSKRKSKF